MSSIPAGNIVGKGISQVRTIRWAEYGELAALFFIQSMAVAIWMVPLSMVFSAHGLRGLAPYAFAASALATFVSPLVFGAMADRHAAPVKVLRGLSAASAAAMALFAWSVKQGWPPGLVLAMIQIYALCAAPTGSIITAIVFSRLRNSQREFGPIRAGATVGWMAGCWLVSALNADASTLAGFTSAATWLVLAAFTFLLPSVPPPKSAGHPTLLQRLGWDAFVLLKNHDHRTVFITVALFTIPLAAFYPFTPLHLQALGFKHVSAWMTLAQTTELVAMFALARTVSALAVEMDFCHRAGIRCAALCALRAQRQGVVAGRHHHARFVLYAVFHHRPNLHKRAGGFRMAGAGAGVDDADDQRRGQSHWLSQHRLVVRRVRASVRHPMVIILGHSGGSRGGVMVYFLTAYHGREMRKVDG